MTIPFFGAALCQPSPRTPTGLSVAPVSGNEDSQLRLTWTDPAPQGFKWHVIEWAADSPSGWATLESEWTGGSPYTHTGLSDERTYYYRVHTGNWHHPWMSGYAQSSGATWRTPVTSPPTWAATYPKDDPADAVSILIKMSGPAPEADTHRVYWKKNASLSGDPPTNADGYFDWPGGDIEVEYDHTESGWGTGDVIYYGVTGYHATSEGPAAFGNATIVIAIPTAPTLVAASVVGTDMRITWQDNSDNEANFRIEYKERVCGGSFGAWGWVADPTANLETYDWGVILEGYEYVFRVRAENAGGDSAYDTMLDGEAVEYTVTPVAPTWDGGYPQVDSGDPTDDVDLAWDNGVTGTIDDTKIYRHTSTPFTPPGEGALVNTVDAAVTTYNDDGLGAGALGTPVILGVAALARDEIRVTWDVVADVDNYTLHRGLTSGFTPSGTTAGVGNCIYAGTNLTFDDDDDGGGLSSNTQYFYKVMAHKADGDTFHYRLYHINDCGGTGALSVNGPVTLDGPDSTTSAYGEDTTWPDTPLSLGGTHDTDSCAEEPEEYWVDLTWLDGGNSGATVTIQHSSTSSSGPWNTITSTTSAGDEAYSHLAAADGDNWYHIKFNSGGSGAYSTSAWAETFCPD